MGTKHLYVLNHISIESEDGPLNMFKPSNDLFTDCSKAALLWWLIFVIYVGHFSLLYCFVCYLQPCYHMLGRG